MSAGFVTNIHELCPSKGSNQKFSLKFAFSFGKPKFLKIVPSAQFFFFMENERIPWQSHNLRSTKVTNLCEKMPLTAVKDFMGHAKVETTALYCKYEKERLYDEVLSESSDDIEIVEDSEGEEDSGSHSKDDYPSYQEEQKNESSSSESSEASDADNSVARAGKKKET